MASSVQQNRKAVAEQVTATYVNSTLTEDTNWRGTIVVKGWLVVAAQTTLRIEPGTVIRFIAAKGSAQLPRLIVMGRIQSIGTVDRPILFTAGQANPGRGEWGGVLLLSSEKRNQFEYSRIEAADTALEGRFSTVAIKSLSVSNSRTGCLLRDCNATMVSPKFSVCDTGLEIHDSEVELRDLTLAANRRGMLLNRSSVVVSSALITGSTLQAFMAEDCRLKVSSCEVSDNAGGVRIKGGEGQIFLSRFLRNRDTALHLSASRMKISRSQISDNLRDGLRLEDDRAMVWGNSISNNGGFNLVYSGTEALTAPQNWWGNSVESFILAKISAVNPQRSGVLSIYPWLTEKPVIFP